MKSMYLFGLIISACSFSVSTSAQNESITPCRGDTSSSECTTKDFCSPLGVSCQELSSRARGAQQDKSEVLTRLIEAEQIPKNTEQLLPQQEFQVWGLPELPQEKILVEKTVMTVKDVAVAKQISEGIDPVRFESGQSLIPQFHIVKMKQVLENLQDKSKLRLHFVGHTDNVGLSARARAKYGNNTGLSESRAKEVAELFQSQLVDSQLGKASQKLANMTVTWEGKGESQPISSNTTKEGRALNRRVEIQVWFEEIESQTEQVVEKVPEFRVLDSIRTQVCPTNKNASDQANDFNNAKGQTESELPPFKISVDGNTQPNETENHSADRQRCTDVVLEKAQVQIQYDNLQIKPRLSVFASPQVIATVDDPGTEVIENQLTFIGYSNYQAFWNRAEIRLFSEGQSTQSQPLSVIKLDSNNRGVWHYQPDKFSPLDSNTADTLDSLRKTNKSQLKFVLRVYDQTNSFDETHPQWFGLRKSLNLSNKTNSSNSNYGENQLNIQNIPIHGGTVTVNGNDVPENHQVTVMGQSTPIDQDRQFVQQQIIPHGYHTVEVAILDDTGAGELFHRDLSFESSDWFYVGIADLTIGYRDTNGPASVVTQDPRYDDDNFVDGRLAFYLTGKTESDWDITASADTRELPIEDLFSNFMNKDPTLLFRRLDPDYYYPTFGDDSTIEEDAPTQGKFYFKAEKDNDFGLWGNFETNLLDTELARVDRGLYGAQGHIESKQNSLHGEKQTLLDLYVAEPGTVGAREEFRGTGGSLYFLRHQNITIGSERVRVEIRDKDTGIVLQRRRLVAGSDYDIDPIQGRVVLSSPLSTSSADGLIVRDDSISGNSNFLVVSYEYTPGFEDLDDVVVGGRISHWINDTVKIGLTTNDQEQTGIDQQLIGTDITLRAQSGDYVKFEMAQTKGLTTDQFASFDGGFEFTDTQSGVVHGEKARAGRVETSISLGKSSRINAFYQKREAGFSATGQFTNRETQQYGTNISSVLSEDLRVSMKLAGLEQEQGQVTKTLDVISSYSLNKQWSLDVGVRLDQQENTNPLLPTITDQGDRTDASIELGYAGEDDWTAFGFVQGTLDQDDTRESNNRLGLGGTYKVNDQLNIDGELSDGDTGVGARIGTEYILSDDTNLYLSFNLDNERAGNSSVLRGRRGNLTAGFKTRYTDTLSIYGEERYAYGDQPTGLTHLYGVDFAPAEAWSIGTQIETGELENLTGETIERQAIGFSVGYSDEKIQYASALEYRNDKSTGNERNTWLLRNELSYKNNENWRTVGKLNHSQSESSQGEFFDGDYTEAVWGYAYRPVENDRWNALFKYTYFFNKPAPEQVSTNNINSDFVQRSHVLSADVNYDWSSRWSFGGKYAFRRGELALDRVDPQYFRSDAHLVVLRADWHVVKYWDFLIEGRHLDLPDANDTRNGFLVGMYRHLGSNFKLGVGYNFTEFSDDLTDLSFDSQGIFLNVLGKF